MSPRSELSNLLATVRSQATSPRDLGHRFELLTRAALTAHDGPQGTQRFNAVWLWRDWASRRETDGADVGIDLVARQTAAYGGGFCAIQCNFLADDQVTTRAVDSFLAASSRGKFTHRLLVTTGDSVQHHGATKLMHAHPPCEVIALDDMASWAVDWWRLGVTAGALDPEVGCPGVERNSLNVGRPRVVRDSSKFGLRMTAALTAAYAELKVVRGSLKGGFRVIGKPFSLWFASVSRRWRTLGPTIAQKALVRTYLVVEVVVGLAVISYTALWVAVIALVLLMLVAAIALVVTPIALLASICTLVDDFRGRRQAFWPLVLNSLKVGFQMVGIPFSLLFASASRRWRTPRPTIAQKVLVCTYLVVEVVVGLAVIGLIALPVAAIALVMVMLAVPLALLASIAWLVDGFRRRRPRELTAVPSEVVPSAVADDFRRRGPRKLMATWFASIGRRWRAERVEWKQLLMRLYLVLEVSAVFTLMLMLAFVVIMVIIAVWLLTDDSKKNSRRR